MLFCKQVLALVFWCHCYLLSIIATTITSGSVIAANYVALTPGHEIVLRCKLEDADRAQFDWFRTREYTIEEQKQNGGLRSSGKEPVNRTDSRFIVNDDSIVIKSSGYSDVGDYTCQLKNPTDSSTSMDEMEKTIQVRPKPYIDEFDIESSTTRSAVIDEGTPLKIDCIFGDDYVEPQQLNVSWFMSKFVDDNDMNEVHSGEDGIVVEKVNETCSTMRIDRVTKDHRRTYKCQVSNGITENSKSIFIRVKDKYIAIWPAAFIIGELVILLGVILFAENRKVEPDKEATYDRKAKL